MVPSYDFEGRTVIVTGGARGIGAATGTAFAQAGARVAICDILEIGKEVAAQLRKDGATAHYYALDVTSEEAWVHTVKDIDRQLGDIQVLVNNAGAGSPYGVDKETLQGWTATIAVCQTAAWLGMKATIPYLCRTGSGAIVNIGSIYAAVGGFGDHAAYHTAKAGLVGLTRSAAVQFASHGIRINVVHPGFVDTPMGAQMKASPREGPR